MRTYEELRMVPRSSLVYAVDDEALAKAILLNRSPFSGVTARFGHTRIDPPSSNAKTAGDGITKLTSAKNSKHADCAPETTLKPTTSGYGDFGPKVS
jgi:hypothetical protein